MKHYRQLLLGALLGLASWQACAACYTVYDEVNRVLYRSPQPPVDMSQPIHETLPRVFPGGHMVFDTESTCEALPLEAMSRRPVTPPSPVLTNVSRARAAGVPYSERGDGVTISRLSR